MKYCYECGYITEGEPLYCNHCGRSYDVKLCPRGHQNPRGAECCSQCGSRELSTPQRKIPVIVKLLAILIRLSLGLLLFYASLRLLETLLLTHAFQELLVMVGVLLAALWALYSQLPKWMRAVLRAIWKGKEGGDD